jgi:hypothetical protein
VTWKQSDPPRGIKPDPGLYGLDDFSEHIVGNVFIGLENDLPAILKIGRLRISFDLIRHLVENADVLKHDCKVDMKIPGQFIYPEDLENGIMGARSG